jgi:hypothetical protein
MAIVKARAAIGRVFYQRCFYLFVVLFGLVAGVPFIEPTSTGRLVVNIVGISVVVAAVAAVGRSAVSFVTVLLVAAPTAALHWLVYTTGATQWTVLSWGFSAALYAVTLVYLLYYVFRREVMTDDRLFGAAAAYLLIGVLWSYLYGIVGYAYPGSFSVAGNPTSPEGYEYLYFSFTVLTSTGFGDVVPLLRQARSLCVVEQLIGTLFLAILIARLVGVYRPVAGGAAQRQ